jgi:hypothetical protein
MEKIVSVIASGRFSATVEARTLRLFPRVLKEITGVSGYDSLKQFWKADPNVVTAINFDWKEIERLAEALYEMRAYRLAERAERFRTLFRNKPSRQLTEVDNALVYQFADKLLQTIEREAKFGRFVRHTHFVLRFVMMKPVLSK